MQKTIGLALSEYDPIPVSLLAPAQSNEPVEELTVDPARLFHHYYLDTRGYAPPDPDPAQFEHLRLLLPCTEIRVRGDGFGKGVAFRKHRSNELGQAFCRWFLYEYLDITYFAHMESVLNRGSNSSFGGLRVERVDKGDTPDYFCANAGQSAFLAEAKGRVSAVSFANAEFQSWRRQFDRVVVKSPSGMQLAVKGHIVATRFATEDHHSRVKSTLFAEDPTSPGSEPLGDAPSLKRAIVALHYADIAAKIRQPLLSMSLETGVPVPPEIQFPATVWELQTGPMNGRRFVGGYFPGPIGTPSIAVVDNKPVVLSADPFRLDIAAGTFVGLEEKIFEALCMIARQGDAQIQELSTDAIPFFYSAVSILRDGSAIAPLEFFRPVAQSMY